MLDDCNIKYTIIRLTNATVTYEQNVKIIELSFTLVLFFHSRPIYFLFSQRCSVSDVWNDKEKETSGARGGTQAQRETGYESSLKRNPVFPFMEGNITPQMGLLSYVTKDFLGNLLLYIFVDWVLFRTRFSKPFVQVCPSKFDKFVQASSYYTGDVRPACSTHTDTVNYNQAVSSIQKGYWFVFK